MWYLTPSRELDINMEMFKLTWNLTAPKRDKPFIQPGYQIKLMSNLEIPKSKTTYTNKLWWTHSIHVSYTISIQYNDMIIQKIFMIWYVQDTDTHIYKLIEHKSLDKTKKKIKIINHCHLNYFLLSSNRNNINFIPFLRLSMKRMIFIFG